MPNRWSNNIVWLSVCDNCSLCMLVCRSHTAIKLSATSVKSELRMRPSMGRGWRSPCWGGRGLGRGCSTCPASPSCCPRSCELQKQPINNDNHLQRIKMCQPVSQKTFLSKPVRVRNGKCGDRREVIKGRASSLLHSLSHISSLCCLPPPLTNDRLIFVLPNPLKIFVLQIFLCPRFQRPALASDINAGFELLVKNIVSKLSCVSVGSIVGWATVSRVGLPGSVLQKFAFLLCPHFWTPTPPKQCCHWR